VCATGSGVGTGMVWVVQGGCRWYMEGACGTGRMCVSNYGSGWYRKGVDDTERVQAIRV
jgi:hypothetical protein